MATLFLENKRFVWIDKIKGFAILLVIIGHVIQFMLCPESFDNNLLFRFIYSFHMPLFFFVSGYVLTLNPIDWGGVKNKIRSKFINFIVPFLVWGLVYKITLGFPYYYVFLRPDYSLWFLWTLFFIYSLVILSFFISDKYKLNFYAFLLAIYVVLRLVSKFISANYGISFITNFFPIYIAGFIFKKYDIIAKISENKLLTLILFSSFLFLALIWYRDPAKIQDDCCYVVKVINNNHTIHTLLTNWLGAISISCLFYQLNKNTTNILSRLGTKTFVLYVTNQFVNWLITRLLPLGDYYGIAFIVLLPLLCILVILFSLLLSEILKKNRITSLLFLGNVLKSYHKI